MPVVVRRSPAPSVRSLAASLVPLLVICAAGGRVVEAQAPSIASTSPLAVKPGATVDVTVRGANLAGATELWTSFPAQAVLSPDVKDNGKNAGQVVFRVTVPAEAPVGVHGIRVVTPGGVSALKLFTIDDLPSVASTGGNTAPSSPQALDVPVAVDGTMPALARHYYAFKAQPGQRIAFEVLARRIGSPLDPMIRLLDPQGRELAYSDDAQGLSSDARLSYTFAEGGQYLVEVRDIRFQGGGNHVYRLRIGDFPCVTVPFPLGVKRGSEAALGALGPDIEECQPVLFKPPPDPQVEWAVVGFKRIGGSSSGFATVAISDREEFAESEPNDAPDKANRVALETNINGRFEAPGDVDRFVFTAKKGQKYSFDAVTRTQGSPSDLVLELLNAQGGKLAEADDAGMADGAITHAFPADGDYTLVVRELAGRGGNGFAYRVEVRPAESGFSLAAEADSLNIPAGGTGSVTVKANRNGYDGPIQVAAVELPKGITSVPTVIGPGRNEVVLTVTAAADAPSGRGFPVRIVGTARIGEKDVRDEASITGALRAASSGLPWPPQMLAESVAVAVGPPAPFTLKTEPAEIVLGQHLQAKFKVVVSRQKDFDEEVTLALVPAPDKNQRGKQPGPLPEGIAIALKAIPKGQNEVELVVSANEKAPLGEFTAALAASHKKGNATTTQPVPGVALKLQEPLRLKIEPAGGKLAKNGTLTVKVVVERNPALSAPIAITFENLPNGVTAPAATIPADKSEVDVVLSAGPDAATGTADKVTAKGEATVGKAKLAASSPPVALTVE